MSQSCEFGTLCNSLIRDRIVCGITSSHLRERLLRETDLSLTKAIEICRATEVSKSQAQHFKSREASGSDEKVDYIKKKSGRSCSKCVTFHPIKQCPAYRKVCHSCNRPIILNQFVNPSLMLNNSRENKVGKANPKVKRQMMIQNLMVVMEMNCLLAW